MGAAVCVLMVIWAASSFINGRASGADEFYRNFRRAEVAGYFAAKYDVQLGENQELWRAEYESECPERMLEETAKRQEAEDDALRKAAQDWGTDVFPDPDSLERELVDVNAQRVRQRKDGDAVYGPDEYDLVSYYNLRKYECETELILRIQEYAMENQEKSLKERYERMSTEELTNKRSAVLKAYIIEPEELAEHPEEAREALDRLERAAAEEDGLLSEEALRQLSEFPVTLHEVALDSDSIGREDWISGKLLSLALEKGESEAFQFNLSQDSDYQCVYYVARLDAGKRPDFEQAKAAVAMYYAAEELDRLLGRS